MVTKLILTGWSSVDAAMAAAIALKKFGGQADVQRVGKYQLSRVLSDLKADYKSVYIFGVGLDSDADSLVEALKGLNQKKTEIVWIGSEALPDSLDKRIFPLLKKVWVPHANDVPTTLVKAAELAFKVKAEKILPLAFPTEKVCGALPDYKSLISAAILSRRNYRDDVSYSKAIRAIADGRVESAWSSDLRELADDFRHAGNRELTGEDSQVRQLRKDIKRIGAYSDARVLILGESGTGKENVALYIHSWSSRRNEPFCVFNCASVGEKDVVKRLFGSYNEHDCYKMQNGLLELANGGTLFLDEIGELSLEAQGCLLRFLECGSFVPVDGCNEIEVNVRIISATNRNLPLMVREGKFREDLFMRLNVIQLRVPSLRERTGDIKQLANGWRVGKGFPLLNEQQIEDLKAYDYPGNVRELFNLLERAVALGIEDYRWLIERHRELNAGLFDPSRRAQEGVIVHDELESAIRRHINGVYLKYGRNASKAAEALRVSRNTLRKYIDDSEKKRR